MLDSRELAAFANVCSIKGYLKDDKAQEIADEINSDMKLRDRAALSEFIDNKLAGDAFSRTDCLTITTWILGEVNGD